MRRPTSQTSFPPILNPIVGAEVSQSSFLARIPIEALFTPIHKIGLGKLGRLQFRILVIVNYVDEIILEPTRFGLEIVSLCGSKINAKKALIRGSGRCEKGPDLIEFEDPKRR